MDTFGVPRPTIEETKRLHDELVGSVPAARGFKQLAGTASVFSTNLKAEVQRKTVAASLAAEVRPLRQLSTGLWVVGYLHLMTWVVSLFCAMYVFVDPTVAIGAVFLLSPGGAVAVLLMPGNVTFNYYTSPVFRAARLPATIVALVFSALYFGIQLVFVESWCNRGNYDPEKVSIGIACSSQYAVVIATAVVGAWYFALSLTTLVLELMHYSADRAYTRACVALFGNVHDGKLRSVLLRMNYEEFDLPDMHSLKDAEPGASSFTAPKYHYRSGAPVFMYYVPEL